MNPYINVKTFLGSADESAGRQAFVSIQCLLLAGLLFLLPFDGGGSIREILSYSVIGAFVIFAIRNGWEMSLEPLRRDRTFGFAIVALPLWGFATLSNSIDPSYSLEALTKTILKFYVLYFITFLSVYHFSFKHIRLLFYSIIAVAVLMSLYGCFQFYQSPLILENRVDGFTGGFYRLATLLTFAFPLLIISAFSFRGWKKAALLFSAAVLLSATVFTFTRAAWVATLVEILLLITFFTSKRKRVIFLILIGLSIVVFWLSYKSFFPSTIVIHGSEETRIEALKTSLEIISKNPVAGIGAGKETFSKYFPQLKKLLLHTHNLYLNTAVEYGLIGLFIYLTILFLILKKFIVVFRKDIDARRKHWLQGLLISLIGFLSLNIFDYMYYGWPGQMFWILVGIGNAFMFSSTSEAVPKQVPGLSATASINPNSPGAE